MLKWRVLLILNGFHGDSVGEGIAFVGAEGSAAL